MKTYKGSANGPAGAKPVEVWEDDKFSGTVRHYMRHSPDGFSWGYGGSGPSELARCLLIDALGEGGKCEICSGSGDLGGNGRCFGCYGEGFGPRVERVYQTFKFDTVAKWPQDGSFEITQEEIVDYVADHKDLWEIDLLSLRDLADTLKP